MKVKNILQFCYDYDVDDESILISLFGIIPAKKILFSDILNLQIVDIKNTLIPDFKTLRLGNRLTSKVIEITKSEGIFKKILITPNNPERYLASFEKFRQK